MQKGRNTLFRPFCCQVTMRAGPGSGYLDMAFRRTQPTAAVAMNSTIPMTASQNKPLMTKPKRTRTSQITSKTTSICSIPKIYRHGMRNASRW